MIEKVLPLLVFAAGGVAVIQDVQTLQRQLLTFMGSTGSKWQIPNIESIKTRLSD